MKKVFAIFFCISFIMPVFAQTDVTFYTTKGTFVVEIYDNIVPITGGNFLTLVNSKFYDGVIFHRVIDNFMIQGGDPTGTGTGGPGYVIQDEFDSSLSNIQKTISMANSGPNSGGSQFFINLVSNTYLDFDKPPTTSKHPVFGKVTYNFSVVQTIGKVNVNAQNKPLNDVVMDSIRVGDFRLIGMEDNPRILTGISVAPNPVIENTFVSLTSVKDTEANVLLFDNQGRQVSAVQLNLIKGYNQIVFSDHFNSNLPAGVYHLNIIAGDDLQQVNLVKR